MSRRQLKSKPVEAPRTLPTREVRADRALDYLLMTAGSNKRQAEERMEEFTKELKVRPIYALEWSKPVFAAAAQLETAAFILSMVEEFDQITDIYLKPSSEQVLRWLERNFRAQVMRKAKWPEHSSSPTSNYMSQCLLSAQAEWQEKLENYIARVGE